MNLEEWIKFYTEATGGESKSDVNTDKQVLPYADAIVTLSSEIIKQRETINKQGEQIDVQDKIISQSRDEINENNKKFSNQAEEIDKLKEDIENQRNKIPEIVGLFSAIIALTLAFINTANNQKPPLRDSYFVLTTIFFSFIFFAGLVHEFFSKDKKTRMYYFCFFILPIIAIITGLFIIFF